MTTDAPIQPLETLSERRQREQDEARTARARAVAEREEQDRARLRAAKQSRRLALAPLNDLRRDEVQLRDEIRASVLRLKKTLLRAGELGAQIQTIEAIQRLGLAVEDRDLQPSKLPTMKADLICKRDAVPTTEKTLVRLLARFAEIQNKLIEVERQHASDGML